MSTACSALPKVVTVTLLFSRHSSTFAEGSDVNDIKITVKQKRFDIQAWNRIETKML
jgi:hypothetical protein